MAPAIPPASLSQALKRLTVVAVLALIASALPASAHRAVTGRMRPDGAIVIPNLSHGQMQVIADNASAIRDLAERQEPTDPVMRRLQGYINLQRFACAWGLMPGSISDEESPFNECAHAYLAATRALLIHLQAMPGAREMKSALVSKIELELLANGASLVLCRYSDEPFNTAEVIGAHWGDVPAHLPTLAVFLAALACGGSAGTWAWVSRWQDRSISA